MPKLASDPLRSQKSIEASANGTAKWKNVLKSNDLLVETVRTLRQYHEILSRQMQQIQIRHKRDKIIADYVSQNEILKLQIGSGSSLLSGWLNSDYQPQLPQQIFLDATKPFPFSDCTFQYVFSEHMIEHISYHQGLYMLRECFRFLKQGGKIRIATPDLTSIMNLFRADKTDTQKRYIAWSVEFNQLPSVCAAECSILNSMMRCWGHQFIYDFATLRNSLEQAGFQNIRRVPPLQSDDENLRQLESHIKKMGLENYILETMVLEGTRLD
jgi:predicted SAM-dependent methyltransferase